MSEQNTETPITVRFRHPNGETTEREIRPQSTTVGELKAQLNIAGVSATDMRLVRAGQVLSDDEAMLDYYDIAAGDTIFVVRGVKQRSEAISPEELQRIESQDNLDDEAGPIGQLMDSPFLQGILSNPELVQEMLLSNPQMQKVIERNSEVGHIIRDKSFVDSILASRKPKLMREMLRNNDRALSNLEATPGGFNHLRRMYENVQEPMGEACGMGGMLPREMDWRIDLRPLAEQTSPENGPNKAPLPNPWARNTPLSLNEFMQARSRTMSTMAGPRRPPPPSMMASIPTSTPPSALALAAATASDSTVSDRFREQLIQMRAMGFTDDEQNTRALVLTGGDVNGAIEWLLRSHSTGPNV